MKTWLHHMFTRWHKSHHDEIALPVCTNEVACRVEERRVVQERLSEHDRRLSALEMQSALMERRSTRKHTP